MDVTPEPRAQRASLTGQALWLLFAKTLAFILSFALPLLLVRRLNQHEFGLYKQAFLVIGTAVALLPLGFAISAFYFLPREEPARQRQVVLNILLFNTAVGIIACLVLALRPSLLAVMFKSSELATHAPLIGVVIMLWIIASFLEFIAIAHQEPKLATVFIVVAQFTKTSLLLVATLVYASVGALIYAAVIQGGLQTIILLFYLQSRFPGFWKHFEWPMLRRQLAYALPLGLAAMLGIVQMDLHNYIVSYHFDAATFAIYAIGCFQLPLVNILSESVGSVMISRVSYLQRVGDHREVVWLTARAMRKLAAIFFPVYALLLIVGREFITVLFTERYLASVPIFVINLTLLPFSIFVLDPVMRAYAEHRYFHLKVRPLLITILFVALWYGTKHMGLVAAIAIMVSVTIFERLLTAYKVARIVGLTWADWALFKDIGKLAGAALVAGVVAALVRSLLLGAAAHPWTILIVCSGAFWLAYLLVAQALEILTSDERQMIRRAVAQALRRLQRVPATDPLA